MTRKFPQRPDQTRNPKPIAHPSPTSVQNYYNWKSIQVSPRDQSITCFTKPGLAWTDERDPAAMLLAAQMQIAPADVVMAFNCGDGPAGIAAATLAHSGRVILVDANIVAIEAHRRAVEANHLQNVTVVAGSGTRGLHDCPPADVVLVRLPKSKPLALRLIWDAFNCLKEGGLFYLAGATNEGIKTYLRHVEELFGACAVPAYRKGCRVGMAMKAAAPDPLPPAFQEPYLAHDYFSNFAVRVLGTTYPICSLPGVFSWDRLDRGTQLLIENMQIAPQDRVLDLGCGVGIVGIVAAHWAHWGVVHMVDGDVNAVEAAQESVRANELHNCSVQLSDCAQAVRQDLHDPADKFDVIVTNPPFHQGQATQSAMALQFVADAAALLKSNGRFYLVANRFLNYEEPLRQQLGKVETVYQDKQFKVLLGTFI
ncbi:MAG: methyltransferase [Caldilineaceae bacterium]